MELNGIGQMIRDARIRKGMTQAGLAETIGVSQGAVGQWEQGMTIPRPKHIVRLSTLLDIPVEELLKAG
jgi:transcriptional regulator with XRE-family HTH domain